MKLFTLQLFIFITSTAFGATDSSQFSGQKISDRDISIYEKLNVKVGDTIITYNGKPLGSAKNAMELYSLMNNGKVSKLLIKRNGRYQILKIK